MKSFFAFRSLSFIALFFLAFGLTQSFAQISGTYTDKEYYYMFQEDGSYNCYRVSDVEEVASGSYEYGGGVINFYNQNGRLTGSYYIRTSGSSLVLSDDYNSVRLRYHASNEDFLGGAAIGLAIGLAIEALFGN